MGSRHELPRWKTNVRVGDIDKALIAESPPNGVQEDGAR